MARINAVSFHETPSIEAICRLVRQIGFDSLELSRPPFYEKLTTRETRMAFCRWADSLGLARYGFDCWVDVQPFSAVEATWDEFARAIDFAVELNLGMIISHDSWARDNADRAPGDVLQANVRLFRRVAQLATERGLRLVFEPHPDTLSMDDAWCIDFIDGVAEGLAADRIGVLYDVCHYGVGQPRSYVTAIERLGRRIQHVHFSDGDARTYALHLPVGDGCLDLEAVIGALKQIGFAGTLTCDMYNYPLLEDGARRNLERIRQVERELGLAT